MTDTKGSSVFILLLIHFGFIHYRNAGPIAKEGTIPFSRIAPFNGIP